LVAHVRHHAAGLRVFFEETGAMRAQQPQDIPRVMKLAKKIRAGNPAAVGPHRLL
jgi:hypothetical protein